MPMAATVADVKRVLECAAVKMRAHEVRLNALDAQGGDGDHGVTFGLILEEIRSACLEYSDTQVGGLFALAGRRILGGVGGASGVLWGSALRQIGKVLATCTALGVAELSAALDAGLEAIRTRGQAREGDKTVVDAWAPAARAARATASAHVSEALAQAAAAAGAAAAATEQIPARMGRSSRLGERTLGVADPGATSFALWLHALASCAAGGD